MFELITLGAWDPTVAEGRIRSFIALVLFVVIAVNVLKEYSKGRKGMAVAEAIVGGVISIFIKWPDVITGFGEWVKSTLGF